MSFNHVPAGKDLPQDFNVIIEIPAQSDPVKYEADKETGLLHVDRFISTGMRYPANYGFIPQTLSGDGDPVDVLVITPFPLLAGSVVRARALGMLQMTDESGVDAKLVAVAHDKVCPMTADLKSIDDVPAYLKDQIKHFFEQYKALEKGKWVKVEGWAGIEAAHKEITEGVGELQEVSCVTRRIKNRASLQGPRGFFMDLRDAKALSGCVGFFFGVLGGRRHRQHRFERAQSCGQRPFVGGQEAFDPILRARCTRTVGQFERRQHSHRLARTRITRARATHVLVEARLDVDGNAGIDAAVRTFEQI